MELRWIPPGRSVIGTTAEQELVLRESGVWRNGALNEQPAHAYQTDGGFYFGTHEVTQEQWFSVMETMPWRDYSPYLPNAPAVCVSWDMANAFVNRLNVAMGAPVYRLPTEEEWEYAVRGGTKSVWFFGNAPDSLQCYGWVFGNSMGTGRALPHDVGLKSPNPWGLHDTYGNAREWCASRPVPYVADGFVGPVQVPSPDFMVTRGGSRNSSPSAARSAARGVAVPSMGYNMLQGFRIVRGE